MIPLELEQETITLPEAYNHSIVLVTGTELRHKRSAYRLQKEFGDKVIAWYEFDQNKIKKQYGVSP